MYAKRGRSGDQCRPPSSKGPRTEVADFPQAYVLSDFCTLDADKRIQALAEFFAKYSLDKRYVDEVRQSPYWDQAAKRGLVLGAAAFKDMVHELENPWVEPKVATLVPSSKQALRSVLDVRFDLVSHVGQNSLFVEMAIGEGNFCFKRFSPMDDLDVGQWIEKQWKFENVTHVLSETPDLERLHIPVGNMVENTSILSTMKSGKLAVVCGPSGSGKTATTLSSLRGYPCIYLNQTCIDADVPTFEDTLKDLPELERNARVVECICKRVRSLLSCRARARCNSDVVLIIDELGESTHFLRALCALHKPPPGGAATVEELKDYAHFMIPWVSLQDLVFLGEENRLYIVAVGAGCDRPEGTAGSVENESYTIIRMGDQHGAAVLEKLLESECLDDALRTILKGESASFEIDRVKRALLNPRVAAAFVEVARKSRWRGCDWLRCASAILDLAFERFVWRSSLRDLPPIDRLQLFCRALALSLGGASQGMTEDDSVLCTRYGLLSDNAKRVTDAELASGRYVSVNVSGAVEDDGILAVELGKAHRFEMSAATLEMILRNVFDFSVHPGTGEGFELTMVDFLLVQLLAGSTGLVIEPLLADPLQALKEKARALAPGANVLFALQLQKEAHTPDEAIAEVTSHVVQLMKTLRISFNCEERIAFAAVARNCDKAPAADAFVVRSTLVRGHDTDGASRWLPEAASSTVEPALSLQFKHYTSGSLCEYEVKAEFFKMGRVTGPDFAGHVASVATVGSVQSVERFVDFVNGVAESRGVTVTQLPSKTLKSMVDGFIVKDSVPLTKEKHKTTEASVDRVKIYESLRTTMNVVERPPHGSLYLVGLFAEKIESDEQTLVQLHDSAQAQNELQALLAPLRSPA